jgi:hypothetical protein
MTPTRKDERAPGLYSSSAGSYLLCEGVIAPNISIVTGRLSQSASHAWGAEASSSPLKRRADEAVWKRVALGSALSLTLAAPYPSVQYR